MSMFIRIYPLLARKHSQPRGRPAKARPLLLHYRGLQNMAGFERMCMLTGSISTIAH
jgi:hypothetical protein